MGLLSPICYASDGVRIFAYGNSGSYDHPYWNWNYVISSNANPSPDLSDLTWSVVSNISTYAAFYFPTGSYGQQFDCTVDDKGTFTILSRISQLTISSYPDTNIRGLQIQPNGTNTIWSNIVVVNPLSYVWDSSSGSQLTWIKDPTTGNNTVAHLAAKYVSDGFYAATLNQHAAAPLPMTQSALWGWATATYGSPVAVSYANGSVYALGSYGSTYYMTALALPSATLTMPTTLPKAYDATIVGTTCGGGSLLGVAETYTMGGKIVITCVSSSSSYSTIIVFDPSNTGTFSTYSQLSGVTSSPVSIVPVANVNGKAPFIFYADKLGGVASVSLASTSTSFTNTSKVVSVAGSFGVNPSPSRSPSSNTPSNGSSTPSSSSSTGLIIGIVAALIVIAGVVFFVLRRRKTKAKATQPVALSAPVSAATSAARPNPAMTQNRPTGIQNPVTFEQHQQHYGQALAQAGMPASVPTTVTGGYPAYSQPQPQPHPYYQPQPQPPQPAYQQPGGYPYSQPGFAPPGSNPYAPSTQPPVQSVQAELMQQFNFSSHPRPSVVTSVKPLEVKPSETANAPLPPVPNVWEPKPFLPPVRNPSPSIGHPEARPGPFVENTVNSTATAQGYATGYGYGTSSAGGSGSYGGGAPGSVVGSTPLSDYTFVNPTNSSYGSPHTDPASPPVPHHSRPV